MAAVIGYGKEEFFLPGDDQACTGALVVRFEHLAAYRAVRAPCADEVGGRESIIDHIAAVFQINLLHLVLLHFNIGMRQQPGIITVPGG